MNILLFHLLRVIINVQHSSVVFDAEAVFVFGDCSEVLCVDIITFQGSKSWKFQVLNHNYYFSNHIADIMPRHQGKYRHSPTERD